MAPQPPHPRFWIGCDVGSTAVKVAVLACGDLHVVATRYRRHNTRQTATVRALLGDLAREMPGLLESAVPLFTGSGGRTLAERTGSGFVQEVNAVALATERLVPHAGSVVDIGGQDAKMILWSPDPHSGRRRKSFSMNDKCAGGTGAVIDRIVKKLGISPEEAARTGFDPQRIHPVAARCGVFAETDINGLQKQGVPAPDLLASLFAAIVQQNLSVLTRGATLVPPVLLLGGPHRFLPGLVSAWRHALDALWEERPAARSSGPRREAIEVPERACFFPAIGAVLFGAADPRGGARSRPRAAPVLRALAAPTRAHRERDGLPGLVADAGETARIEALAQQAAPEGFGRWAGRSCPAVIGLDAGSTSTKAVVCDERGRLLAKSYRLSGGDPLADARAVLGELEAQAFAAGTELQVRALGTTGYAKDMLAEILGADTVLVETVAHTRGALAIDPDCEVIADVGGQDIKVLVLRDGRVRDFRLNSQCSAGNGYFLQSTAARFGIPLERFAAEAFHATHCPRFSFGCAVFLEADIANFQQLGWQPGEILAGLARVLPQNVWLYVVNEPNLARLGRRFLLQGGTQRNVAAVKAQVDFVRERVPGARIRVHPHAGEAGAIGVALELLAERPGGVSRFIGFEALRDLRVRARQDESTRCRRCRNRCARTLLEATLPDGGVRRYMIAACDLGRELDEGPAARARRGPRTAAPDFSARAARLAFVSPSEALRGRARQRVAADRWPRLPGMRAAARARERRAQVRIGLPRAVNLYQTAPLLTHYLVALGIDPGRILFSGETSEALYRRGSRRGAVDGCYPSKLALAHVHDLLYRVTPDWILFPILVNVPRQFPDAIDASICPTSQAAPAVVRAALTREGDLFAERGIRYETPVFHVGEPALFAREMLQFWGPRLGVTPRENRLALDCAWRELVREREARLRQPAARALAALRAAGRVGIVVLGRPYHNDAGINHGIFRDLNRRGYPIFCIEALPRDAEPLREIFADDLADGRIRHPLEIGDVWKNSFSANSNAKLWAAKLVARVPHLVALDISSFRCGHDAPIYATIEAILERSGRPYFAFHDVDENRPSGAIRLRVETIDYFLREYERRHLRERPCEPAGPEERAVADLLTEVPV
ncbi:MAG: CoA activase [Candidatus Eisenbacteria bacterium]|nr:CoA activase [Candidatus Eisenbacteria bacterium]